MPGNYYIGESGKKFGTEPGNLPSREPLVGLQWSPHRDEDPGSDHGPLDYGCLKSTMSKNEDRRCHVLYMPRPTIPFALDMLNTGHTDGEKQRSGQFKLFEPIEQPELLEQFELLASELLEQTGQIEHSELLELCELFDQIEHYTDYSTPKKY
uniref:Uncharacterized protein n=1 Tax=Globodera rostochiensis TaxID=31243 RepID=A0A914I4B4_GLORO